MERYESLGLVGEGSYGTVLKCRHRDSGRLVAIKKFVDSDDDKTVKKIALREIKLLRQLRHDNLVNLLEVWKRRRRWYLVFEFVERTLLDDLEQNPNGLDLNTSRQYLYQILRAVAFCHQQHVIHRDIKPENILISQGGVVKLCDFGFARTMTSSSEGGVYTDYVATRWYRAPELLVGDTKYGKPVDVWAVGCLLIEMLTGQPLFPGDSDLDQIYHIVRCFGNLTAHHQELFYRNPVFSGVRLPECSGRVPLEERFPSVNTTALDLAQSCLQMDPEKRTQCSELLEHPLFTQDSFHIRVLDELNAKIQKDHRENSTLPKIAKTSRREKDEGDDKNRRGKDKKQSEDMDVKVNKEKEKRNKESGEEKIQKSKGKLPLKTPKTIGSPLESLSVKQTKTLGTKSIDNASKTIVAIRSKPGKAIGTELRKDPDICKLAETPTSDSLEASKTATDQVAKPKHGEVASPEPRKCHSKNMDTKDRDSTGLRSSCSNKNVSSRTEKGVMEIWRSKSEPSQDSGKSQINSNTKVSKLSKSSTTDHPNESPSRKASLKSIIYPAGANSSRSIGKISSTEHPESAATDIYATGLALKASHPSSSDHTEDATSTTPSVAKQCKTNSTSEHQNNHSNIDTEPRRTCECPQVLPSNPKPSKTTSNFGQKVTTTKSPLSTSPSKTLTSSLSELPSTVCKESSPAHSTTTLSKETLQTGSSSHIKPTYNTSVPNMPSRDLPMDPIKNHQDSLNTSNQDINEDPGCLKMSLASKIAANHPGISKSFEPCSLHGQSVSKHKITAESRTSTTMPIETPKISTPVGTTIPKTLKVSNKENREDFALSMSIIATTKTLVNQTSKVSKSKNIEQKNNSSEDEPNIKSSNPSHCKSLIKGPKAKLGSFTTTTMTQKTTFSTDTRKKTGNPERNNTTNIPTSFTSTVTPDHKASARSSVFHSNTDINEFDLSQLHYSPPPPPPPPSSTPLLLPPSSTPLIPSFSVVSTDSPVSSDQLNPGASFHPGTLSVWCVDNPRHHGGITSRLAQQSLSSCITGSFTAQVSQKSLIPDHSFLSDHCNHGNSDGITVAKRKSDIHLPDLRSLVLPELRGREGKHDKGTSKEQRKENHLAPSVRPSEPQQHGYNSTDSHSP